MYFVAIFLNEGIHVIIPKSWVLSIDDHWEKFINNSINRNQRFLCFFSEQGDAMIDQKPNGNFVPNFNLDVDPEFPKDGCYIANLIFYKGMY